jgi:hypothetical protein
VIAGDQVRLVTVYCVGEPGVNDETVIGVPPVAGATNPVTPIEVIVVSVEAAVIGNVTVKVSVLLVPVPPTVSATTVPVESTVGIMPFENV